MTDTSLPVKDAVRPDTVIVHPLSAVLAQHERSAAWLGRKTGKSVSYVTRVISGERRPSADFQQRAATTLGVPAELLFPPERAA